MTPPDFTRRVQENPQIAVELYEALSDLVGWFPLKGWHTDAPSDAYRRACVAISGCREPDLARAHAHYTELARQAAERNGEEVLD